MEAVFAELERRRNELIFPTGEILIFKNQLRRLFEDITKDVRRDELSDIRVIKGGYPAGVSIFSPKRFWRRAKAYRKEKKEIKKLGRDLELYEQVFSRIVDEFRSGIRQDFLFLLIELFKRVDIADKRLEEIKQDLELVLKKLMEVLGDVKKTTAAVSTLLRNEPQLKAHPKFLQIQQDIEKIELAFKQILQGDFRNTEALRKKLKEVLEGESVVIEDMYKQALKLAA